MIRWKIRIFLNKRFKKCFCEQNWTDKKVKKMEERGLNVSQSKQAFVPH